MLAEKLKRNKEDYYEALGELLINGIKGYKNLSMKQLIDILQNFIRYLV